MLTAIRDPQTAETIELAGGTIRILLSSKDTDGEFALSLMEMPPNYPGPVAHRHRAMKEVFYVLEGEFQLITEDGPRTLTAGEVAMVPAGTAHRACNPSDKPVKILSQFVPGGMEQYFRELADYLKTLDSWPPKDPQPLTDIMSRYDMEVLPDFPF